MRVFLNVDSGFVWTEDEIRKAHEQFGNGSFEDYMDEQIRLGKRGISGLVEMEPYDRIYNLLKDAVSEVFHTVGEEFDIRYYHCPQDLDWDIDEAVEELAKQMAFGVELNRDIPEERRETK